MAQVQTTGSRRAPRRAAGSLPWPRRSRAILRRPAQLPSLRLRPVSDHRPKYEPSRPRPAGPPTTGRCAPCRPGRTMAVMTPAEVISSQLDIPKPGRYRISPAHSTVTIRTRHFFGLGAVRATLALRDGRIVVAEPPEASTVQARFAALDLPVGQRGPRRRRAVAEAPRRRGLPQPLVHLHRARPASRGSGRCAASLRCAASPGWSRPASARSTADGATLRASAQASIDRYDFGITAYRGLAARRLTVNLAVIAHREES